MAMVADRRFKVLIVDDEQINIQVLTAAFRDDYELLVARNGDEAVIMTAEQRPDLVLLDVMMPGMNGFEVCRILKSNPELAEIPVIFLTAMDSSEAQITGLGLGGVDYITKPIIFDQLRLRMHNHLEIKRRNDIIKQQRDELEQRKLELESALARIKRLEGVIPICMHCKSIRDDNAVWQRLEQYIVDHSDAHFSHGICPTCIKERYPDLVDQFPAKPDA